MSVGTTLLFDVDLLKSNFGLALGNL